MQEKRLGKLMGIRSDALMPTEIGGVTQSDVVIVTWGSNRGVIEEALEILGDDGCSALHFHQVYPLPERGKKLFTKKKIVVLENNATGQFANLLKLEYGVKISRTLLKSDGDPFSVEEVVEILRTLKTEL